MATPSFPPAAMWPGRAALWRPARRPANAPFAAPRAPAPAGFWLVARTVGTLVLGGGEVRVCTGGRDAIKVALAGGAVVGAVVPPVGDGGGSGGNNGGGGGGGGALGGTWVFAATACFTEASTGRPAYLKFAFRLERPEDGPAVREAWAALAAAAERAALLPPPPPLPPSAPVSAPSDPAPASLATGGLDGGSAGVGGGGGGGGQPHGPPAPPPPLPPGGGTASDTHAATAAGAGPTPPPPPPAEATAAQAPLPSAAEVDEEDEAALADRILDLLADPSFEALLARVDAGLANYKYVASGLTWLDDVHQPAWNAIVNYLPTWLAPNLITLAGLACLTGAYVVTAAFAPALEAIAPRWVYALMAAATFVYLHLDVLDGKQARRTGSSSPLGQLFDHGCDALAVHLLIVGIGASIDTGLTARAVVGQLAVMSPWIAAHWEEYHSGHIRYGNGWWGVTEANYVLIVLHLITACAGPGVWRTPAPALAARLGLDPKFSALPPRAASYLASCVGTDLLLAGIVSAGVFQVSGPLWRVLVSRRDAPLPAALRGAKQLGRSAAAVHAAHLALLLGLGAAAMMEPIRAGRPDWHVRVVFGSFGIVYALEASKLIMDHMAKEPFEPAWWPLALLAAGVANSAGGDGATGLIAPPDAFDVGVLLLVAGGYLHYVLGVISETCAYLGIGCLTIKSDGKVAAAAAAPAAAAPKGRAAAAKPAKAAKSAAAVATATTRTTRSTRARK